MKLKFKLVGYDEDGRPVMQISRNKYETPHQSTRERARRLKQMINRSQPRVDLEANLITEYLKCKT